MKRRILNVQLAFLVADLRHGEMLFIAGAGGGTSGKAARMRNIFHTRRTISI